MGPADQSGLLDPGNPAVNPYGMAGAGAQGQYTTQAPVSSTALTRRGMNRALIPTGPHANFDTSPDPWSFVPDDGSFLQQPSNGNMPEHDNIEELEEMASVAMREAKTKRKQIPPFVQKLSR